LLDNIEGFWLVRNFGIVFRNLGGFLLEWGIVNFVAILIQHQYMIGIIAAGRLVTFLIICNVRIKRLNVEVLLEEIKI